MQWYNPILIHLFWNEWIEYNHNTNKLIVNFMCHSRCGKFQFTYFKMDGSVMSSIRAELWGLNSSVNASLSVCLCILLILYILDFELAKVTSNLLNFSMYYFNHSVLFSLIAHLFLPYGQLRVIIDNNPVNPYYLHEL